MEVFRGIDEEDSWESLSDGQVHQFSHAVPDILELANVERDRVADALDIASGYSIVAWYCDSILARIVHVIVDEVVDDGKRSPIGVDGGGCRLILHYRLL